MKRFPRFWSIVTLLFCLPLTARADAGTPLMWAGLLHLVLGNAVIGIFEGTVLAWLFKLKTRNCILAMIPANYFSAWIGGVFLNYEITTRVPFDLYNAWHWIWAMVLVTFLLTLVLEWPFVRFCFRGSPDGLKRSLWGNLAVNSLSYALLFAWYWLASGTTLHTKMNVVRPPGITFPQGGTVYFISETNGVCTFDFSSRRTQEVYPLTTDRDDRLFLQASASNTNNWDILDSTGKILVSSNLPVLATTWWRDNPPNSIEGTEFNFGEAAQLAAGSDWNFRTGFWPIEGFRGINKHTGEQFHFSLETPFVSWTARNATHLPGDYVVFQLGENQICLFETATKKVALLARGQGPVVVLPRKS